MRQHGGGVHDVAIRPGEQVGGFQEDRGAVFPRHVRPGDLSFERGIDRQLDLGLGDLVVVTEHLLVVVRGADVDLLVGLDLLAVDD